MKGKANPGLLIAAIVIILVAAAIAWWLLATSNNTTTPSTTGTSTTSQTATQNQIRTNWVKFFSGTTDANTKVSLLQNGQAFTQYVQAQSQSPTAQSTTASVANVSLNSDNKTATVTYTISQSGTPVLQNQTGQAILENGVWKVSDASFCQLLQLSGNVPPACPGGGSQTQTQASPSTTPNSTTTH